MSRDAIIQVGNEPSEADVAAQAAHNAAMIAKAEANRTGVAPAAPVIPAADDSIPEKFLKDGKLDEKALLAAYKTLEAGRNKPADPPKPVVPVTPAAGSEPQTAVQKAQAEFEANGTLADATFDALAAEGLDRPTVEAYISNITAVRLLAHTAAGGEEKYAEALAWAADNMDAAATAAYDEAVNSNVAPKVLKAVQGMMEKFNARNVETSMTPSKGGSATTAMEGFRSKAEMTAAMADPRYKKDAAYRKDVEDQVRAAKVNGVDLFR